MSWKGINDLEQVGIARDFQMSIAMGDLNGSYGIHKFGRNKNLGTAIEDVWTRGGVYTWQQTATVVSLWSSSANDTDTTTATGVRKVKLIGLGSLWERQIETVSLAGASTVSSTKTWRRMSRAYAVESGTYDGTTVTGHGIVSINQGGTACAELLLNNTITFGQTHVGRYTVPASFTAFLTNSYVEVDSNKAADFYLWQRRNDTTTSGNGYWPKRIVDTWIQVKTSERTPYPAAIRIEPKTDIWFSAKAGAAGTDVQVRFDLFCVPNSLVETASKFV